VKIGILGGGQLARMMAEAAKTLDLEIVCIDPDNTCSATHVTTVHHCSFADTDKIREIFADVDVITYETENLPIADIEKISHYFPMFPNLDALKITQDRLFEKQLFTSLQIATPDYLAINTWEDLETGLNQFGYPCVLKTRRSGYDGKGQAVIKSIEDAESIWPQMQTHTLILEKFIPYEFELSIISARDQQDTIQFYPLTHNSHQNGILRLSLAPYQNSKLEKMAQDYAATILRKLDFVGIMTIEFFCKDDTLIANEIAPRVHNSGHWTIEGAECSQFENHLRAIAGLPLGSTATTCYSAMINCIGQEPRELDRLLQQDGLHYHTYQKAARANRKLGHITLCADTKAALNTLLDHSLPHI
jgi:5-(carboxyamino)imidazole ribonucleotide synthase